jgi:hypothetical protein
MSKKLVITGILECPRCPYHIGPEAKDMPHRCGVMADISGKKIIGWPLTVPDWCPLPDES